jgi:hypothetical protein
MADQWLSIVEYARTFKVSDMTVRRRIKTGRLHAVLKEGKYFIPVPVGDVRATEDAPARPAAAPARPAASPMTVIKGHPAAYRTITPAETNHAAPMSMPITPQAAPTMSMAPGAYADVPSEHIPETLRRPMLGTDASLVDTRALLAFCEAALRKFQDGERRVIERFKSKLETLEATLAGRDQEIKTLRQQLEDLQVLVQILEKKRG